MGRDPAPALRAESNPPGPQRGGIQLRFQLRAIEHCTPAGSQDMRMPGRASLPAMAITPPPQPPRGAAAREPFRALPREPRMRPGDERAHLEGVSRTARRVAVAALAVALLGTGFSVWRALAPADAGCQAAAWDTAPVVTELPLAWTVSSSQFDLGRKTMTLLGPTSPDGSGSQAVLYTTITCFAQGAAESVTRSAAAAKAAGQTVTQRTDLGDQGFLAADASGAIFLQFRRGSVVVYIAASGDATSADVEAVASSFDHSMGGTSVAPPIVTPVPGGASPSSLPSNEIPSEGPSASAAAVAPELEAVLPKKVGDTVLTIESALGTTILSTDQGSRAIVAALRAEGKVADDLKLAQAYDAAGQSDLSILAVTVTGMKLDAIRRLVLDSWLAATGAGVKTDTVTLAGRSFTRVDYGDGGVMDYLLAERDFVIIIETADANVAAQAAAALP
jgi:hypothetical protein